MLGGTGNVTHLSAGREHQHNEDENDSHAGNIRVRRLSLFAGIGLYSNLNLLVSAPMESWIQHAEHEDNHHRTQTLTGFGDLNFGLRWLFKNENIGPGQRLFAALDLAVPTGQSYSLNPFSEDADSTEHTHMAIGKGHLAGALSLQWWLRSEFPLIIGLSSRYSFPLGESDLHFRSGPDLQLQLELQAQHALWKSAYPLFKIRYLNKWADHWKTVAPNSGGSFFFATAALVVELNEFWSLVPSLDTQFWQSVNGEQLRSTTAELSFRRVFH